MRILAIDFGDRNIGLAVSDELQLTAQPLESYRLKGEEEDKKYFQQLVRKHNIGEIIIGLPLRMDGSSGTRAEITREFAKRLEKAVNLPIILWDERLTTHQALGIMRGQKIRIKKKKSVKDQISATIILHSYLEKKRMESDASQDH